VREPIWALSTYPVHTMAEDRHFVATAGSLATAGAVGVVGNQG
jgi:hypothetical protein